MGPAAQLFLFSCLGSEIIELDYDCYFYNFEMYSKGWCLLLRLESMGENLPYILYFSIEMIIIFTL